MEELKPNFRRIKNSVINGERIKHTITFIPNKANPGEEIYIDIPKLKPDTCLVPGSLNLKFDFKNKNTKSWFLNNLGKLLVKKLKILVEGEVVYDNSGYSEFEVYKDLWLSERERIEKIEFGIINENIRKLISGSDDAEKTSDAKKVSDALVQSIIETKQKIKLDKIIGNHGLYYPYAMKHNFQFIITLSNASSIMMAQSGENVEGYTLENIELEYEVIENKDLANQVIYGYDVGRNLSFEHVTLMKTIELDKDSTLINETVNLPRKSMRAIVMLFRNKTISDSEEYIYPNIELVNVTIEGFPNNIYSQGIKMQDLYSEAKRLFMKDYSTSAMRIDKFFKDKFGLVVDLRTIEDKNVVGCGREILNTQSGILLEIKKKATSANLICKIFVISDGLINFKKKAFEEVFY